MSPGRSLWYASVEYLFDKSLSIERSARNHDLESVRKITPKSILYLLRPASSPSSNSNLLHCQCERPVHDPRLIRAHLPSPRPPASHTPSMSASRMCRPRHHIPIRDSAPNLIPSIETSYLTILTSAHIPPIPKDLRPALGSFLGAFPAALFFSLHLLNPELGDVAMTSSDPRKARERTAAYCLPSRGQLRIFARRDGSGLQQHSHGAHASSDRSMGGTV